LNNKLLSQYLLRTEQLAGFHNDKERASRNSETKGTDELIWLLLRIMGTHLLIKAEDFEVKPFK
jgi:hypothetical protein